MLEKVTERAIEALAEGLAAPNPQDRAGALDRRLAVLAPMMALLRAAGHDDARIARAASGGGLDVEPSDVAKTLAAGQPGG